MFSTEEQLAITTFAVLLVGMVAYLATPGTDNAKDRQRFRNLAFLQGGSMFVAMLLITALYGNIGKPATDIQTFGSAADYGWVESNGTSDKYDGTTAIPTLDDLFEGYSDAEMTVYMKSFIEQAVNATYVGISSIYQIEYNPIAGAHSFTAKFNANGCTYRIVGKAVMQTTVTYTAYEDHTSRWSTADVNFRSSSPAYRIGCKLRK